MRVWCLQVQMVDALLLPGDCIVETVGLGVNVGVNAEKRERRGGGWDWCSKLQIVLNKVNNNFSALPHY